MPRILQITDPHVLTAGSLAYGVVDTGAAQDRTVAGIRVGAIRWRCDLGGVCVFGLDTQMTGAPHGALGSETPGPRASAVISCRWATGPARIPLLAEVS
ncbi:hypothetical protein [Mameliella alba]|uniref:Uncharacterized protein n=1 Tax=Mameliella alba TaxID=561184 RepID=A0A0B3RSN5_9RHOB|nr:hypothetical protein [Mameliella alba]KHQ50992.1 hypothetical protein OA50_04359 [Mameliella alba]